MRKRKRIVFGALSCALAFVAGALYLLVAGVSADTQRQPIRKVVLITIDTLRADRMGCYGHGRPTTPNIDAWAKGALLFERAMVQAPWTVPSMASMLTGRYPVEVGAYTNRRDIGAGIVTLAELFKQAGFATASFNTNPLLMWPDGGFCRGFDENRPQRRNAKIPFAEVEPHVMRWLDEHAQEDFFVWIHNMDPHSPPTQGNPYREQREWDGYDAEVKWVDELTGRLFDKLVELGVWDEVLLVFTSDHGEAFSEHLISGHQDVIYDEVLHVPLIVKVPGLTRSGRIGEPVELVDLYRTIAELAGLPVPDGVRGESLVPIIRGAAERRRKPYLFHSRYYIKTSQQHLLAVRDREWKLVAKVPYVPPSVRPNEPARQPPQWTLDAPGTTLELYRIDTDPRERINLIFRGGDPAVAERLQRVLLAWGAEMKTAGKDGPGEEMREVDEATLELLRALGYRE